MAEQMASTYNVRLDMLQLHTIVDLPALDASCNDDKHAAKAGVGDIQHVPKACRWMPACC